jgi:tRNA(Met) C34 N-acetyltransferase TmcA
MVEDDPLKWETEPIENFLDELFLFRGKPQKNNSFLL